MLIPNGKKLFLKTRGFLDSLRLLGMTVRTVSIVTWDDTTLY